MARIPVSQETPSQIVVSLLCHAALEGQEWWHFVLNFNQPKKRHKNRKGQAWTTLQGWCVPLWCGLLSLGLVKQSDFGSLLRCLHVPGTLLVGLVFLPGTPHDSCFFKGGLLRPLLVVMPIPICPLQRKDAICLLTKWPQKAGRNKSGVCFTSLKRGPKIAKV